MLALPKTARRIYQSFRRLSFYALALFFIAALPAHKSTARTAPPASVDRAAKFSDCTRYLIQNSSDVTFASDNVKELFISTEGKISLLLPLTLEKIWSADLGGTSASGMLLDRSDIYLLTRSDLKLRTDETKTVKHLQAAVTATETLYLQNLDRATGITKWQTKIEVIETDADSKYYIFIHKSFLILIGSSGKITLFAKEGGQKVFERDLSMRLTSPPFISNDKIVLGTLNREISHFSLEDKNIDQAVAIDSPPTVILRDSIEKLVVGDQRGFVSFVDERRKTAKRKFRSGAEISSINETAEGLLVTSLDNFAYLLSKTDGELIWKKRLVGRVSGVPLIVEDFFIVSSIESPDAGVYELKTGKFLNRLTVGRDNFFTGQSIRIGNRLFFTTLRGIDSFSFNADGCAAKENKPDG